MTRLEHSRRTSRTPSRSRRAARRRGKKSYARSTATAKDSQSILLGATARAIARSVAQEMDDSEVGKHLGVQLIDANVAVHRFAARVPGYRGWQWHVSLTALPGSDHITVNEASLIAGKDALTAPSWVPYSERIQPGDLVPDAQLPLEHNDPRVTVETSEQPQSENDGEIAENRAGTRSERVRRITLSDYGLSSARRRWKNGAFGPQSEFARKASLKCASCAFYLRLPEEVGRNFGVCANEYSADGHVVHSAYGCGAHSLTPPREQLGAPVAAPFDDERAIEI